MFSLISVADAMPVTTSVKMIEIWMLFCLLLTFTDVLLQTYIKYQRFEC
jgi:hypothetical protein